jgi:hypothetical protein
MSDVKKKGELADRLSRRSFLGAGSVALATATFVGLTADAQQRDDTCRAEGDHSSSNPGPSGIPLTSSISESRGRSEGGRRMRELHWHPNASEWQSYIAGKARMTVFMPVGNARTMDYNANDAGCRVP